MFAAIVAIFGLPNITQDAIDYEDVRFREYLVANGYDTSKMGLERIDEEEVEAGSDTAKYDAEKRL
jgi:hypothetical protein